MKKVILLILCGIFIVSLNLEFEVTTAAKSSESTVKQYEGMPSKLNNKYWMVKDNDHKEFYYGTKRKLYGKHTKIGSFYSKWLSYMKVNGVYIITGTYSDSTNDVIWWFVKPNKSWTKIRIGFTKVPFKSIPDHSPSYYMKSVATRVTKVTAMLY